MEGASASVTFDEKSCDIIVDGRGLASPMAKAFGQFYTLLSASGFLNIATRIQCLSGFVMLDSPLRGLKQKKDQLQIETPNESEIDPGIEAAFWTSIAATPTRLQIIVFDNKSHLLTLLPKLSCAIVVCRS